MIICYDTNNLIKECRMNMKNILIGRELTTDDRPTIAVYNMRYKYYQNPGEIRKEITDYLENELRNDMVNLIQKGRNKPVASDYAHEKHFLTVLYANPLFYEKYANNPQYHQANCRCKS